jgi:membrane protease YdiL (CAAX protease family)
VKHRTVAVTTPAPPSTPFHQLAAPGFATPRVFVAILVGVAGVAAVTQIPGQSILAVHWTSHGIPARPLFGPHTPVMSWQAETALALTLLLTVILVLSGSRLRTSLSVTGRVRWAWLGTCTLIAFGVLTVLAVVGYGAQLLRHPGGHVALPESRPTTGTIILAVVLMVLACVYAVALELLFRGWYLQALRAEQTAWMAIFVQAFQCTISHAPRQTVWGYADLALYAVVAGWLTITTGGTEATIAFAIAWNASLIASTFLIAGDLAPSYGGIAANGQNLAIHLTAVLAYAVSTRLAGRHRCVAVTALRYL